MAKGFYISKSLGILGILLGVAAICTIVALSVVYAQEKNRNAENSAADSASSTTTTTAPATTVDESKPWNRYRLPTSLVPISYQVTLRPYFTPNAHGLYIFEGKSTVRFSCQEATNMIIIHSKKLNYTTQSSTGQRVALRSVDGSQPPAIDRTELVERTEYLVVHLQGHLSVGREYEMDSQFQGELADDLAGFYRSEYRENGQLK